MCMCSRRKMTGKLFSSGSYSSHKKNLWQVIVSNHLQMPCEEAQWLHGLSCRLAFYYFMRLTVCSGSVSLEWVKNGPSLTFFGDSRFQSAVKCIESFPLVKTILKVFRVIIMNLAISVPGLKIIPFPVSTLVSCPITQPPHWNANCSVQSRTKRFSEV